MKKPSTFFSCTVLALSLCTSSLLAMDAEQLARNEMKVPNRRFHDVKARVEAPRRRAIEHVKLWNLGHKSEATPLRLQQSFDASVAAKAAIEQPLAAAAAAAVAAPPDKPAVLERQQEDQDDESWVMVGEKQAAPQGPVNRAEPYSLKKEFGKMIKRRFTRFMSLEGLKDLTQDLAKKIVKKE
jgi:hypothetical protein